MNGGTQTITGGTPFVVAGKKVTAFGGFLLDTNGNPKGALVARVYSGTTLITQVGADGFYFAPVPPGTYRVKIYDGTIPGNLKATGSQQNIVQDQFVAQNFTNLNPADPVISGFVINSGEAGVAGVTVELYNVAQHLVGSKTTSASGSYAFCCTAPGSYTVQVVPPAGYAAQPPVTLDVKMFDEVRGDFSLSAQ